MCLSRVLVVAEGGEEHGEPLLVYPQQALNRLRGFNCC